MGRVAVCSVFTDASDTRGWGAILGGVIIQGEWPKTGMREGVSRKEMWVRRMYKEKWGSQMSG